MFYVKNDLRSRVHAKFPKRVDATQYATERANEDKQRIDSLPDNERQGLIVETLYKAGASRYGRWVVVEDDNVPVLTADAISDEEYKVAVNSTRG